MIALVALILIVAILGGLGFAAHFVWLILGVALILWAAGFFIGGAERMSANGNRTWFGRT